jgi:hypothetical protein
MQDAQGSAMEPIPSQPQTTVPKSRRAKVSRLAIWGLAGLIVLIMVIVIVVIPTNGPRQTNSIALPPLETNFISIVAKAQGDSRQADNDMQKGGIKAKRESSICNSMTSFQVQDWIGTIKTIDSNSDGKGVLEILIAPDVLVKTWNNAFSDIGSNTLIEPGSPVFQSASAMKSGQRVVFSGTFLHGSEGDCLREGSLRLDGKLQSPAFIFQF